MNKIMLIGNLTKDPDSNITQDGVNFTRFVIAVNRPFTNSNGERIADYFDIICWRMLADRCAKYLYKGCKVGVAGSVQRKQYEDRDGIKRTSFTVVADEVEFLTPRNSDNAPQSRGDTVKSRIDPQSGQLDLQPVNDDDLPF